MQREDFHSEDTLLSDPDYLTAEIGILLLEPFRALGLCVLRAKREDGRLFGKQGLDQASEKKVQDRFWTILVLVGRGRVVAFESVAGI